MSKNPIANTATAEAPTTNARLRGWVEEVAQLTKPDQVHWCDGSVAEYERLCQQLVDAGTFERLSETLRPGSSWHGRIPGTWRAWRTARSSALSASRTRGRRTTGVSRRKCARRCARCSTGRCWGARCTWCRSRWGAALPISYIGVQLTDSAYVAASMRIMTRMGQPALQALGAEGEFVPCLHSVGYPRLAGREDVPWPCDASNKWIVHFPETREIWSYGSGYGGNALLGKKCLALRIASVIARDEGWLAEHMLIVKLTSPEGKVKYIAGAFPSACGKTNLSMLIPHCQAGRCRRSAMTSPG